MQFADGGHDDLPRAAYLAGGEFNERFALLRSLAFLADFHDVALWELMRLGRWVRVPAGTLLMQEGAAGDSFSLILEGEVAVTRQGWELSVLGPGVTIGEMTYLRPEAQIRSASATARTDALLLKVRNPALRQASEALQSHFDKAFIRLLVSRLIATNEQLAEWDLVVAPSGPD